MKRLTRSVNRGGTVTVAGSKNSKLDITDDVLPKAPPKNLQAEETSSNKSKKRHKYTKDEVKALIGAVKARPVLWTTSSQFDFARKDIWQDVFEELNIPDLELSELKSKWYSLRQKFKQCSDILNTETCGHGASLQHDVQWTYFKELLFLYDADGDVNSSSSEDVSFIKMEPEIVILGGSPAPPRLNIEVSSSMSFQSPTTSDSSTTHLNSNIDVRQSTKGRSKQVSSQPNIIHTSTPPAPSLQNSAISRQKNLESNKMFCNHILTELRMLSGVRARRLRRLLMQNMHDFMISRG